MSVLVLLMDSLLSFVKTLMLMYLLPPDSFILRFKGISFRMHRIACDIHFYFYFNPDVTHCLNVPHDCLSAINDQRVNNFLQFNATKLWSWFVAPDSTAHEVANCIESSNSNFCASLRTRWLTHMCFFPTFASLWINISCSPAKL